LKNRKKWLTWLVDFIYADIPHLENAKRVSLMLEVYSLVTGEDHQPRAEHDSLAWTEIAKRFDLRIIQKSLHEFFEFIVTNIERSRTYENGNWKNVDDFDFSPNLNHLAVSLDVDIHVKAQHEHNEQRGGTYVRYPPGSMDKGVISTSYRPSTEEGYTNVVLFAFVQMLDGVSLSSFKQCPECDHWFINASKKTKVFCSNSCASRYGTRRKRAARGRSLISK